MHNAPYQALADAVEQGLYQLDEDQCIRAVNAAFAQQTGYPREKLIGSHISLVLDEIDLSRLKREIRRNRNGQDHEALGINLQTANGDQVPYTVQITLLRSTEGIIGSTGILHSLEDTDEPVPRGARSTAEEFRSVASVLDEAHIGVIVLDPTFNIVWTDQTIEEYLGLDRQVILAEKKTSLLDEVKSRFEDPDRFEEKIRATYADNSYIERFEVHVLPDEATGREERWLEHWSKPIESGRFAGGRVELYYDVTDRKRSKDQVWESKAQFESLVNAIEEYAIFHLDTDGHILSWNEGARTFKGYDRDEILGQHLSLFYTPEDREQGLPEQNLAKAAKRGFIEQEGWRKRKDGSRFWARLTLTAIHDDKGEHQGFIKITRDLTEEREHEQRLQEERDLVRRILETSPVGILVINDQGTIVQANTRIAEITGLPPEAFTAYKLGTIDVYDAHGTLIPPNERPPQKALQTGEPAGPMELSIQTPDDETRWLSTKAAPILDDEGNVKNVIATTTDITQLKIQAERLERQRDELRTEIDELFERIDDAFYAVDREWRIDYANEAFAQLTDRPRSELVGANLWNALPDLKDSEFATLNREAMQTEDRIEHDLHHERSNTWLHVSVYPSPTGQSVYLKDITERKKARQRLEQHAHQKEAVARLGQFALETDDLDELFHEASRTVADVLDNAYCKVLDLDPFAEELLLRQGVGWDEGIVGNATVKSNTKSQAGYTLLSEEPVLVTDLENETRFQGPDLLTSHDVKSGISTIIGPYEDPWGILGTHDTRHRDHTKEDVNFVQSIANILAEAIERHAYEDRLEDTITRLQESNQRLERFAYAASHDLQEPLRMVSSYLRLLDDRYEHDLDKDAREFIGYAVDGADRMREMIEGLLAYARVDTQGQPLEPVNAEEILDDVLTDLTMKIQETDATITSDPLPTVKADPTQLGQVFQNLIKNALTYAGDKPPRVHIQANKKGHRWVFSVEDEGIGIDPENASNIFKLFERGHPREQAPGSGMGLAITQRIIERHNGRIWVDTQPQDGATFHFTLEKAEAPP